MKVIKRPSIFHQQKLENKEPDQGDLNLPTISTICVSSKSNKSITPTSYYASNASTKVCISIPSTKGTNRKISVDLSYLGTSQPMNFKTESCKYWESGIECPYAKNCRFAHGQTEKRDKETSKNLYKTKICKNYFELGSCKYGKRCQFLHEKTPYERQKQYYRKRMSQIHKDTELFFLSQKRLGLLQQIQLSDEKENTVTPPSSQNSIISSNSLRKKQEKSDFSLQNYCRASTRKSRHFSICL